MIPVAWTRFGRALKKWTCTRAACWSLLAVIPSCTSSAGANDGLPTFSVPTATAGAATTGHDTTVTLYYNPRDCFTCFGVVGHWAAVANATGVTVRLSLDDQPDVNTLQVIRRMRLPFELGITAGEDEHSGRPRATMKELLTVHGRAVDSAIVQSGAITSPLLRQLRVTR